MRVLLYLLVCVGCIAGCAWVGFTLTGFLFPPAEYELGTRQIGKFVGAFAAGTGGFMAVMSLSIVFAKQLGKFFDPFAEMNE